MKKIILTQHSKENEIKTYELANFPTHEDFMTYRKLKEIPYYYYYDDKLQGVQAIVPVRSNNVIKCYKFNYNEAKNSGFDVILVKDLNVFENFSYVYAFDDYNDAMSSYLDSKKKYLMSCKDILVDQIMKLENERTQASYNERERLMDELEKKLDEILDIYDNQIIIVESKLKYIDKQLSTIDEITNHINNSKN